MTADHVDTLIPAPNRLHICGGHWAPARCDTMVTTDCIVHELLITVLICHAAAEPGLD